MNAHSHNWTKIIVAGMALGIVSRCVAEQGLTDRKSTVHIIPHPAALQVSDGVFRFTAGTLVVARAEARAEAAKLIDYLTPAIS